MHNFAEIIGIPTIFFVTGWIIRNYLDYRRKMKFVHIQADMQTRLLDKFGSSQEMIAYLQSDAGQTFAKSLPGEDLEPYRRILGSIQAGLVLTLLGIGSLVLKDQIAGGQEGFTFLGVVALTLGIGFILSAAAAYRLSRSWGLINGTKADQGVNDS